MIAPEKRPPITAFSNSKKLKIQVIKEYYENKIQCLKNMNLPPSLVLMACWDAPIEREDLGTSSGRKKFLKRCLKYYDGLVKQYEREEKKYS